jgi:hypothetical protein
MINARNATSADFEKMAQNHANSFWWWAILSGIIFFFAGWYGAIPTSLGVLSAFKSVGATSAAMSLRKGTYRIPNPNNGAPDGDARNWNQS